MAEVSEAELTTIENALVMVRQALEGDDSPAATQLKEGIVEAEQIVSGKLDSSNQDGPGTTNPSSTAQPEQQMANG